MHLEPHLVIWGLLLGAATLAPGCSMARSSNELASAGQPVLASVLPEPQQRGDVRFAPAERERRHRDDEEVTNHRRRKAISLYGEWGDDVVVAPRRFDGGRSLIQVSNITEGACFDPAINQEGALLVFASTMHRTTSDLYLKPTEGKTVTQLTTDPNDDMMPVFSPDGQKIAFASNRAGQWDIFITSIDGGPPVQVTNNPDPELHPSWSPDGKKLAYCRFGSLSNRWELWVIDLENPGIQHFLDYGLFPEWCPNISRSKILFQRARQRGSRLHSVWTLDFVKGEALHPTEIVSAANAAAINPSWSPDGDRIVFVTVLEPDGDDFGEPQQSDIWMISVNGDGRTNLTSGRYANFQPTWGANGYVYFISSRTGVDNIWAVGTARAIDVSNPYPRGYERRSDAQP